LNAFETQQRRLIIGISHHIVGAELPLLLKLMSDADPSVLLEVRIASSREVLEDFDQGVLDAAVVMRHDHRRLDGEVILKEAFAWMGSPDFKHCPGQALRLATQSAPCSVRHMATGALDAAGISGTEVFVGGGIATIGAALLAGLAVAAVGRRVAPPGTVDVGANFQLPALPTRDIVIHTNPTDSQARNAFRALVAALRSVVGT
jgi:DNA-binding transcriptional LysR family regulator